MYISPKSCDFFLEKRRQKDGNPYFLFLGKKETKNLDSLSSFGHIVSCGEIYYRENVTLRFSFGSAERCTKIQPLTMETNSD